MSGLNECTCTINLKTGEVYKYCSACFKRLWLEGDEALRKIDHHLIAGIAKNVDEYIMGLGEKE